jgi:murein DD-endopeptidase MepM/ murein hydrolase activator NlpD
LIAVAPVDAYFAGAPVHVVDKEGGVVEIVRRSPRRVVRAYERVGPVDLRWGGLTSAGRVAPNGRYAVRLEGRLLGSFDWHTHVYPIRGPHDDRGGIGVFHAPRNGGRIHEGYDVMSPCGTPLVAARGGRVRKAVYDPVLYGNLVIIRGRKTRRDYWYAHLSGTPRVARGDRVRTGQRLGSIGATGNAASVGCHLHFELRVDGDPVDPAPHLHAWDRWS